MLPVCYLALAALLCASALAQEKPEAPKPNSETSKPKTDRKVFFVGVSLLAASKTADAITTRQLLDRGGWENNPVFGRHPSPAKQAGVNAAIFAGEVLAFHFTERSHRPWLRWLGRTYIGFTIVEHSRLAACNAGIDTRSPVIQNCGPLAPF